jgi:uncharacterized membrane protein
MYVLSIVIIVTSNILYNICQKSTPEEANPFSSLLVTYLTASIITVITLLVFYADKSLAQSVKELNWTSIVLGISIVGLEFGYLMAYRSGWNISEGSLVANIILALMLIPVGMLFYKEGFALRQTLGVLLCVIGLLLLNKK